MTRTSAAPRFSVVMPAYDCALYIGAAVTSVLTQTESDLELIVVDDGSTDGTDSVVAALALSDVRVRLLRRTHAGIAAAMNVGIAAARGQVLARLDADDLWRPDFLASAAAELTRHPDAGVVYARAAAMRLDGTPTIGELGLPLFYPGRPLPSMLRRDCTTAIAFVVRRAYADRVGGYDESFRVNEDWDYALRLARRCRFVFIDRVLAYYRLRPNSTTRSNPIGTALDRVRVLDKMFADPELPDEAWMVRGLAYRNVYFDAGLALLAHQRDDRGAALFLRGISASGSPARAFLRLAYDIALYHAKKVEPLGRLHADLGQVRRRFLPKLRTRLTVGV